MLCFLLFIAKFGLIRFIRSLCATELTIFLLLYFLLSCSWLLDCLVLVFSSRSVSKVEDFEGEIS